MLLATHGNSLCLPLPASIQQGKSSENIPICTLCSTTRLCNVMGMYQKPPNSMDKIEMSTIPLYNLFRTFTCSPFLFGLFLSSSLSPVPQSSFLYSSTIFTTSNLFLIPPHPPYSFSLASSWATWGSWSECSATCQGGTQIRHRTCQNGNYCPNADFQVQYCNSKIPCSSRSKHSLYLNWMTFVLF